MAIDHHMKFLQIIADADVRHVQDKERTYKGSWKKRGGAGAFHMLARKWDRLENMANEEQGDLFKTGITGEDGTMLAEIRDLRRYLLLVEAEVMALHPEDFPRPGTPADGGQHSDEELWRMADEDETERANAQEENT